MPSMQRTTLAALIAAVCHGAQAETPLLLGEATQLQAITVHAEQDDFDARRDASSTRLVYGREELDRMNELSVGDYLRRLPSVTFTGPPGTPKDVRMRGMDKGYTQILIDGEPVMSGTKERQIQVDRIPLDMVERIEIIRAPTADMPNEGVTGTINIVLREAPGQRMANVRLVTGRVLGEKTDKDTWNLSGQYGGASERVRWLLNAAAGAGGAGVDALLRFVQGAPELPLGRFAEVRLHLPAVEQAVALPHEALYGRDRIYRLVEGRMAALPVERLGETVTADGSMRLLLRSPELRAGDRVITTRLPNALEGLRVVVAE